MASVPTKTSLRSLSWVVLVKMAVTAVFWVGMPLFCSMSWLQQLGAPNLRSAELFIRLLGMAYAALLTSYTLGYLELRRGRYPAAMVWTGIVSNGWAFLVSLAHHSTWSAWTTPSWLSARLLMSASLVVTGLITASLALLGPVKSHPR